MRTVTRSRVIIAAAVLSSAAIFSQDPLNPNPSAVSFLLISAKAKDGSVELAAADLEIKEDGKSAQILQVRKLDPPPIRYCALFGISGSENDRFVLQQETATRLLHSVLRPRTDRGWISLFSIVSSHGEETDDPEAAIRAIATARAGGGTALYDSVSECADRMGRNPPDSPVRVMFLFTDGEDNQSESTRQRALDLAMFAGVRIYAVSPDDTKSPHGSAALRAFTENTGGEFFSPWHKKDIDKVVTAINDDLRNVFRISYQGDPSRPHKIEMKCIKKGVTILAPKVGIPSS